MTGITGFIIALVAGFVVPNARRACLVTIVPWLCVLAFQTWSIAAGHGVSPPSAVDWSQLPSYLLS